MYLFMKLPNRYFIVNFFYKKIKLLHITVSCFTYFHLNKFFPSYRIAFEIEFSITSVNQIYFLRASGTNLYQEEKINTKARHQLNLLIIR